MPPRLDHRASGEWAEGDFRVSVRVLQGETRAGFGGVSPSPGRAGRLTPVEGTARTKGQRRKGLPSSCLVA